MRNGVQLFLAANTILLICRWNRACSLLVYVISVITPGRQRALTALRRYYLLKNKLRDRMIKQLFITDSHSFCSVNDVILITPSNKLLGSTAVYI